MKMVSKSKIRDKVEEIRSVLLKSDSTTISLVNGIGSEILFFSYYSLMNKKTLKADKEKIHTGINQIIRTINNRMLDTSFSHGLTGISLVIKHIKDNEDLDLHDILKINDSFIEAIVSEAKTYMKKSNFDLLTGAIGLLIPLLNYEENKKYKSEVLSMFSNPSDGKWQSTEDKSSQEYNLGLAHGIPSIIVFLSLHSKITKSRESYSLIKSSLEFISSLESNDLTKSRFPSTVKCGSFNNIYDSRLGWCYGDLGIANAFWQAGKAFDQKSWKHFAIDLLKHSAKRTDLKDNFIYDCGLCHGTSGIAHIFNRFYKETNISEFNKASLYWLDKTISMADNEAGLAGYKKWSGENNYENDSGLLEGIAGIGLALIGFLNEDIKLLKWDRCLLLS